MEGSDLNEKGILIENSKRKTIIEISENTLDQPKLTL